MKKRLYVCSLVAALMFSACSHVLYEATEIHYFEHCGESSCGQVLARLTLQCKGEVVEAYVKYPSAIVRCRPATPAKPAS